MGQVPLEAKADEAAQAVKIQPQDRLTGRRTVIQGRAAPGSGWLSLAAVIAGPGCAGAQPACPHMALRDEGTVPLAATSVTYCTAQATSAASCLTGHDGDHAGHRGIFPPVIPRRPAAGSGLLPGTMQARPCRARQ